MTIDKSISSRMAFDYLLSIKNYTSLKAIFDDKDSLKVVEEEE